MPRVHAPRYRTARSFCEREVKSSNEIRLDLGKRLAAAAKTSAAQNVDEAFAEERWQLVADTIDMMIDRAFHEFRCSQMGKESLR